MEKPSVDIFNLATRIAGCSGTSNCWHIGNSKSHDIAGAILSNWNAILLEENAHSIDIIKQYVAQTKRSHFTVNNIRFVNDIIMKQNFVIEE